MMLPLLLNPLFLIAPPFIAELLSNEALLFGGLLFLLVGKNTKKDNYKLYLSLIEFLSFSA